MFHKILWRKNFVHRFYKLGKTQEFVIFQYWCLTIVGNHFDRLFISIFNLHRVKIMRNYHKNMLINPVVLKLTNKYNMCFCILIFCLLFVLFLLYTLMTYREYCCNFSISSSNIWNGKINFPLLIHAYWLSQLCIYSKKPGVYVWY